MDDMIQKDQKTKTPLLLLHAAADNTTKAED